MIPLIAIPAFFAGGAPEGRAANSNEVLPVLLKSETPQWMVRETAFITEKTYDNPLRDARVEVSFESPSGGARTVLAFWDGGDVWKARFSPDEPGEWSYRSECSNPDDGGLHGRTGTFTCVPYTGSNPLYKHGALRLSENRRHMVHADGTPFFWMADTVWNGALLSDQAGWIRFLQDRIQKKFTAIQFVMTQWRAAEADAQGQLAFTGVDEVRVNPEFFQRMDHRVQAVNDIGLIASPVILWAIRGEDNPGHYLPVDQRIALAEYIVARYGANQVVWMLGGDGDYSDQAFEDWKTVGRAVFGEDHPRLTTMHPRGQDMSGDRFRAEPWFHFIGYQSGHGDGGGALRWLTQGPPSEVWKNDPPLPVINLEPNYEAHNGYTHRKVHDDLAVRRAAYWSLLVSPPAGVTYGAQGVWGWHLEARAPKDHESTGIGPAWHNAMDLPGSQQMKYLVEFFKSMNWWELVPAQDLLVNQPGSDDPRAYATAAKSAGGSLAVVYLPEGTEIQINTGELKKPAHAMWYYPKTGTWVDAGNVTDDPQTFKPRDRNDWLLCVRSRPE